MDKYAENRPHRYGRYISSKDWSARFLNNIDSKQEKYLLSAIKEFLCKEKNYSKEAADRFIDMEYGKGSIKFEKAIKRAEKLGYLEKIKLNGPWHPKPFFEGEAVTYPFQHSTAIVYRGINRDNFYKTDFKAVKDDRSLRNQKSLFQQGHIVPGNSSRGNRKDCIWTSPRLDVVKGYAETNTTHNKKGLVLELQVPTKWISIVYNREIDQLNNLKEMHEHFGSPSNFLQFLEDDSGLGLYDELYSFLITTKLPLEFITGVWDLEYYDKPKFIPFNSDKDKDIFQHLKEVDGRKVPDSPRFVRNSSHDVSKKQLIQYVEDTRSKFYDSRTARKFKGDEDILKLIPKGRLKAYSRVIHRLKTNYFKFYNGKRQRLGNFQKKNIELRVKELERDTLIFSNLQQVKTSDMNVVEITGYNDLVEAAKIFYNAFSEVPDEDELGKRINKNEERLVKIRDKLAHKNSLSKEEVLKYEKEIEDYRKINYPEYDYLAENMCLIKLSYQSVSDLVNWREKLENDLRSILNL